MLFLCHVIPMSCYSYVCSHSYVTAIAVRLPNYLGVALADGFGADLSLTSRGVWKEDCYMDIQVLVRGSRWVQL